MTAFLTVNAFCVSTALSNLRDVTSRVSGLHPIAPDRRPARHWRMRDNAPELPPG
jgi:hypothetical protein